MRDNKITKREIISDALRYWERWRILYNVVLILVTIAAYYLVEGFKGTPDLHLFNVIILYILAVMANLAYSCVYAVELELQLSPFRHLWRQSRWVVFVFGTIYASYLALNIAVFIFIPCDPLEMWWELGGGPWNDPLNLNNWRCLGDR